jgi:uncharacterized protein YbbK (DUF523 family)
MADRAADLQDWAPEKERPRVGVSACLLGERVRYDGGHKRDRWITGTLGRLVEFVPVCPEVEFGLGTPRPPIRLEQRGPGRVRLVEAASGEDLTVRMERYAARRVGALAKADLDGYILKANSPSCGPARVKVRTGRPGAPRRSGRGLFAAALLRGLPDLPVEDEERLGDPRVREEFLERVLARHRARRRTP